MVAYTLIRSKRKTLALYIIDGQLEVRAPIKASKAQIENFIASKEQWISVKLAISKDRLEKREAFRLTYGEKILFLGQEYPIIATKEGHCGFDGRAFCISHSMNSEEIKSACIQIYRDLAKASINQLVAQFSEIMGVAPKSVNITEAKTRWGSCSQKKAINFSWFLIMAHPEVVEYVVVHELAHIKEMNHSKNFWAIVKGILPDYNERKARLKELQKRLASENWYSN